MGQVASADFFGNFDLSFTQTGVDSNGHTWFDIAGYCIVPTGGTAASLPVIIPNQQKNLADVTGLVIPANAYIAQVGFCTRAAVTLGATTGKLKLAPALTTATAGLYVESAAAVSNTLASQSSANAAKETGRVNPDTLNYVQTQNITPVTVGGSPVTYSLYATDGGAAGAAAASTVTSPTSSVVKVLVRVQYLLFRQPPTEDEIGYSAYNRV